MTSLQSAEIKHTPQERMMIALVPVIIDVASKIHQGNRPHQNWPLRVGLAGDVLRDIAEDMEAYMNLWSENDPDTILRDKIRECLKELREIDREGWPF